MRKVTVIMGDLEVAHSSCYEVILSFQVFVMLPPTSPLPVKGMSESVKPRWSEDIGQFRRVWS